MRTTRVHYQHGSIRREARKHSPAVWVFRWREYTPTGRIKRKEIIGTVDKYKTKASAIKACESLRSNINRETRVPRTFGELVAHYRETELAKNKTPYTIEVYEGYLKTWILSEWKEHRLSDIHAVAVESWLENLPLAHGTRAKLRNLMHVIYNHGIRCRFTGENPITFVRQSAKRGRVPDVLTVAELTKLLSELKEPWRTAIFVASTTGLRVSELLALKWQDFDFTSGQLNLCRGIVRQQIGGMKSEASRKPLPLDAGLADVLLSWRRICPFNQDADYVFGSLEKKGQQPYWPTAGMEDHVRPAAKRAGITKRIGWHTLRHTFGTLVKSQGADVATTQALMRHANVSITMDRYVQAVGEQKRQAQHSVVGLLAPNGPTTLTVPPASC
jgi:integrase